FHINTCNADEVDSVNTCNMIVRCHFLSSTTYASSNIVLQRLKISEKRCIFAQVTGRQGAEGAKQESKAASIWIFSWPCFG
ncbi:hypothetical protein VIGAN_05063800, partial [Vigna angularis var. angularis]